MNLRRSWRNTVDAAWSDAIYTTDIVFGLPLICISLVIWNIAEFNWPVAFGMVGKSMGGRIAATVAVCIVLDAALSRKMKRFKDDVSQDRYRTTGDNLKVAMIGIISLAICVSSIFVIALFRNSQ